MPNPRIANFDASASACEWSSVHSAFILMCCRFMAERLFFVERIPRPLSARATSSKFSGTNGALPTILATVFSKLLCPLIIAGVKSDRSSSFVLM